MSTTPDPSALRWVASSYSGDGGGNCIEWSPSAARVSGVVPVRDSKAPDRQHLTFSAHAFATFVDFTRGTSA